MKTTLLTTLVLSVSFSTALCAQESVNSASINTSSSVGSVTSSIGQTFYETAISSTGSVAPGVQQAYEITSHLGIDVTEINLSLAIYPNPTQDILNLKVDFSDYNKYHYQLTDSSGKLITSKSINLEKTSISMTAYPAAVYYLKVMKGSKSIKVFKVLKTNK